MSIRRVLGASFVALVGALAGLLCIAGCWPHAATRASRARALELVREAERTMHRAGGIADFWLPTEVTMEERGKAPADQAELEAMLREAILLLKQALQQDPKLHRARFDIAVIHLRLTEPEQAETWAKGFLKVKPNDPDGLTLLATSYFAERKWRELAELCEAAVPALEADEAKSDVVMNPSYFMGMAAIGHFYMGELAEARKWAEAAIEEDDGGSQNYCLLAIIQHGQGDAEGLAATRATLKELDPEAERTLDATIEAAEKERLKGSQP